MPHKGAKLFFHTYEEQVIALSLEHAKIQ